MSPSGLNAPVDSCERPHFIKTHQGNLIQIKGRQQFLKLALTVIPEDDPAYSLR
jgi:hypothetical protein